MTFLLRHRTICAVLAEIEQCAYEEDNWVIAELCKEAITYARAMSARLEWYWKECNAAATKDSAHTYWHHARNSYPSITIRVRD